MIALLVAHAVLGAVLFPTGSRLGRRAFLIGGLAPLATLVWVIAQMPTILDGGVVTQQVSWVPQLGLSIDLRLDGFSTLMVLLVAGIGVAIAIYSAAYFSPGSDGLGRSAGLLVLFAGAMLTIVFADNLLVLYVGWELTSVTSYLLIGNDHTKIHARAAALHTLLVTSLGGLAMLAGFVLVGEAAGTYSLSAIVAAPPSGTTVTVGLVLILVGAFTKSAQYPFHSWLPGAMAAPTPVTAYLHSATMVKAGVYLIARLAPAFASVPIWRPLVLGVGITTMILGGLRALRQDDLKLLLAYGTVSQLGFLVVLFGAGTPAATTAGYAMILAHALFKAALFMAVGTVDHHTGTRDLRRIPTLPPGWRPFALVTIASAASMAGIPLLFGFVAKESAFEALLHTSFDGHGVALAGVVIGSALTVAYASRFVWGMFAPLPSRCADFEGAPKTCSVDRPDAGLLGPAAALGAITLVLGVDPSLLDSLATQGVRALDGTTTAVHYAVWHGFNAALVLSAIALATGGLLFVWRARVAPLLARGAVIPSGTDIYTALLRGTNNFSTKVTGVVQNGSLPIYAGVVLLTAALVPGYVLATRVTWTGWPPFLETPAQLPVVIALIVAAVAATAVRRRFSAALFLGTTGYAMAGLFVVQGAPDLALTQVAIETLSTVLFVLVLRRLPDRFERRSTNRRRAVRVVISALVGVSVFAFAIISRESRTAVPVSGEMVDLSLPEAHGRNVVDVILIDVRGFDTLGEITVLTAAAIGAVALARVGRRRRRIQQDETSTSTTTATTTATTTTTTTATGAPA